MLAAEDVLTLNASSDEPVYCILAVVRPTGSNQGPRILLGLEQARDSAKLPAVNADRLALERDHRGEEGGVGLARHQLIEGHEGSPACRVPRWSQAFRTPCHTPRRIRPWAACPCSPRR